MSDPCRNDHAPKGENGEHEPASYCAGCLYELEAQLQAAQEKVKDRDDFIRAEVGLLLVEIVRLRGLLREVPILAMKDDWLGRRDAALTPEENPG